MLTLFQKVEHITPVLSMTHCFTVKFHIDSTKWIMNYKAQLWVNRMSYNTVQYEETIWGLVLHIGTLFAWTFFNINILQTNHSGLDYNSVVREQTVNLMLFWTKGFAEITRSFSGLWCWIGWMDKGMLSRGTTVCRQHTVAVARQSTRVHDGS